MDALITSEVLAKALDFGTTAVVLLIILWWSDKRIMPVVQATFEAQQRSLETCQARLDEVLKILLERQD